MKFIRLHELPQKHALRNAPLSGFAYRTYEYHGKGVFDWSVWKRVGSDWPISSKTYNELGDVWISKPKSEWRPTKELEKEYNEKL